MTHPIKTGGDRGYLRIATEEAFATRELIDAYLRMIRDGSADKGMVSVKIAGESRCVDPRNLVKVK